MVKHFYTEYSVYVKEGRDALCADVKAQVS